MFFYVKIIYVCHNSLVFPVFEPEPVRVPQPHELLLDDLGEEGAGAVDGLKHAADVPVKNGAGN